MRSYTHILRGNLQYSLHSLTTTKRSTQKKKEKKKKTKSKREKKSSQACPFVKAWLSTTNCLVFYCAGETNVVTTLKKLGKY